MTNNEGMDSYALKLIFWAVLFIIVLVLLFGSVYTVSAGYRGVLLTFGKPEELVIGEGLHFKIPVAQQVVKMEVRTQKYEATASSASRDLQDVQTSIALIYHISPEAVKDLYQSIGAAYQDRIISPAIQESVKAVTAEYTAEELITKRSEVKDKIRQALTERLASSYIIVEDLNIVNFAFSEQFNAAIEGKQVAEQNALKAQRDLDRVKIEAEQKVAQAQAEAESLKLQAEQLRNGKDILQLRAIEKWDGKLPVFTGGGAIPFLDINKFTSG